MKLLGIDNIFSDVTDLEQAILFYSSLGFQLKFKIPQIPGALFSIGSEEPGLLIRQSKIPKSSCFWVEVVDAHRAQKECVALNITGNMIETATGFTFEITDPWGNKIGFADYTKKPELARDK